MPSSSDSLDAPMKRSHYDVVILGGGHNGLVAAAYLARAGLTVLIVERRAQLGGAAISQRLFAGMDARLSAYAYLVSLLPDKIVNDLELRFETRRRAFASFTPTLRQGGDTALLISNVSEHDTEASFKRMTGTDLEYERFKHFNTLNKLAADRVAPTLLKPLLSRDEFARRFYDSTDAAAVWKMLFEEPLGESIEQTFHDDLVRGMVFTDAKIGVMTHPQDESLLQNRTFLYHIIGSGGEWRVPVGGMGALTAELERVVRTAGAELLTSAEVTQVVPGTEKSEVAFSVAGTDYSVSASYVLANVAPSVLSKLLPGAMPPAPLPEGSVFKINMLLKRLPRLRASGYWPEQAFAGTFHIDEGYEAMRQSYQSAMNGEIPENPPGEVYCHSLTDSSILSPELKSAGYHTLTLFGLDMPYRLFEADPVGTKQHIVGRYLRALNTYLTEPIEGCLAQDQNGGLCLDAKSPVDLEDELALPRGNIFHADLTWPYAENPEQLGTWGVATNYANVFLCGSGAQRGGCVSGIPGHNAAMQVLERQNLNS